MADYKIEPDGKLVTFLKAGSHGGSEQNRRNSGEQVSFQSIDETAEFVRAGECHGFTFEGKEFLAQAS
jgi:hypothetical protein